MQRKYVDLFQGKKLWLKMSKITGSAGVFMENSPGEAKQKMVEVFPVGKYGKSEYSSYMVQLKDAGLVPKDALACKAAFQVDGRTVEVENKLISKRDEMVSPLHVILSMFRVAGVNEITVYLDGTEIFRWQ